MGFMNPISKSLVRKAGKPTLLYETQALLNGVDVNSPFFGVQTTWATFTLPEKLAWMVASKFILDVGHPIQTWAPGH
jgi:lauroyl/myristoyl acyltransferase